jgi:hypothetical protein
MTEIELFDTARVHDDAQHWDALASRVIAQAMKQRATVLQWLAAPRAVVVAVAVVLGALAILLMAPQAGQSETRIREQWAPLVAPADPVGRTIAIGNRPPSVSRLFDDARGNSR